MQVEQLTGQRLRTDDQGKSGEQRGAHLVDPDIGGRPAEIIPIERFLALLRPAALVSADGASVVSLDGPDPTRDRGIVVDRPADLVGDEHALAGRAAGREHVADRGLETGVASRRGGQALEGRVEVAYIRRPQHDLRQHPGQRIRFERHGSALTIDGRPGDPAPATEQVGDDVPGP